MLSKYGVHIVPADGLAPQDARISAGTMMTDFGSCIYAESALEELTHYGLMTPYGNNDLGQHWLR